MNIEELEDKIKNMAKEQVDKAIDNFKSELKISLGRLLLKNLQYSNSLISGEVKDVLSSILNEKNEYPSCMWRRREEAIRNEVMSTFDIVQRIRMTKDVESENKEIEKVTENE
jgi:hypothetical protein